MIVLSKSKSKLTSKVKYRCFIMLIFASVVLGVSYSNESFAPNFSSRIVRRSFHYTKAIKERRETFKAHPAKDVDRLGKEIAIERSALIKKNVSINLCQKMQGIKCKEDKPRHEMQLTRRKASALQIPRQRIIMQLPENSEVKLQKTIKKRGTFLPKPPGHRRSKLNRNKRAATAEKSRLWEHATIPYVFDSMFSVEDKIRMMIAMRTWEIATCVSFKEKEAADKDYFMFTDKGCGCCADVGRKEHGVSSISLAKDCRNIGIIMHELGHIIGFWHEHTRPDRDEYVDVILEHAIENKAHNFIKNKPEEVDSLGEPYDVDSIMHYGRNKFAKSQRNDTIVPKTLPGSVVRPTIGQRYRLSPGDIRQTNKLYKCASCGQTFQEDTATFSHKPTAGKSETCHWRIRVAYGERIVLNITSLRIPRSANCVNGHLEVRDGPNSQSPQIGRFCGGNLPGALKSSGRRMWLEYKTLHGKGSGFTAHYVTECGGGIRSEKGIIASPTYYDRYLKNLDCSWNITVEPGYTIALNFEFFELETSPICEYDYLEIREGNKKTDPLIGKYCGLNYPKKLNSKANQLFFRFVSDSETQRKGFYISFVQEID
ncbi:unnamed protein product [Lymnaea stagnalis]|uniref:Metalloendopeptidase n=1 Tax=Lymnaea stagnalis TaxID=6523 RepID=A0AAV2HVQ7_LYMST